MLHWNSERGGQVYKGVSRDLVRLILGLFLFAVGIACTVVPALGLAPWDSFHMGLHFHTGLTFGQASILVGAILLVIVSLFGEPLGFGTVLNVFFIGYVLDIIMRNELFPFDSNWIYRLFLFFMGMVIIAVGSWLYIGAGMGAGPRDGLMLTVMRKTGLRVAVTRILIEGTAAFGGFLLGAPLGLGTILIFLFIGPIVGIWFRMVHFDPNHITHKTFKLPKRKPAN